MCGDIFGCHHCAEVRCASVYIEAWYGALHPTTQTGQYPTTKNYLIPNVTSVTVEKPQVKVCLTTEPSLYEAYIKDDKNNLAAVTSN